ncbi:MAG: FtsH protease activity modulator HflK [Cellulosilyticaceae bacterium]
MNPESKIIDIHLDDQMRAFGKKFKKMFGGIVGAIVVLVLILSSVYRLQTGTVGVITRFGKIMRVNENAGIHFKVPLIDKVQNVDVETVHKMEYGFRTAQTGSVNNSPEYAEEINEEQVIIEAKSNNASIILLNLIVRYQVSDPVAYLYEVDDLEGTMRLALEDVIRSTLPGFTIDEALENKEMIDQAILPKLQKKLDQYQSGIKIVQVTTQNVSLLPSVEETRQKVEESNQYKQGREEESQKYANTVVPKAEAEATKMYEDARGYSAQVVAEAKADVAEFEALYSQYVKNPQIVKEKYYIEAMQQVFTNNEMIIDQTNQGNLLKFFSVDGQKPVTRVEEGGN